MTSHLNHSWIHRVQSIVAQTQDIPMWGSIPPFPWKEFGEKLTACFQLSEIKIEPKGADWKKEDQVMSSMGQDPFIAAIELPSLEGAAFLTFPKKDFSTFISSVMNPHFEEQDQKASLTDLPLQLGFFRYLTVEATHIATQLGAFGDLTPNLSQKTLEKGPGYCIDFQLTHNKVTTWGRVICLPSLQKSIKRHFSQKYQLSIPSHLHQQIFLNLHLSAGTTRLSQSVYSKLALGDFILLDRCSYSPKTNKGTFQLSAYGKPLFQVKLKDDQIKILDYALYYEDTPMEDYDDDEPTFDEDAFLPDDQIDEIDEPSDVDEPTNESLDEDAGFDHLDELSPEQEALHDDDERSLDEELKDEDGASTQVDALIAPDQISISLSVELAQLKMSLEKLLTLKPGNVLHVKTEPNQEITLVANGERVARGQLIQVGDVVGVKLTQIGT